MPSAIPSTTWAGQQMPMTRAHVTTLLPSLALSSKITAVGDIVGTIDQDRSTGIYGSLGAGPVAHPDRRDDRGRGPGV